MENDEARREKAREGHLIRTYDITSKEYNTVLNNQGGVCGICKRPPKQRRLHVDHSHGSGLIRGILCYRCNKYLLKAADDNPEILRAAALYLEHPPFVEEFGTRIAPEQPKRKRRRKKKA